MNEFNEEYQIVKILLEQYTPSTHGVKRALKLLEDQQKEIERLEKSLDNAVFTDTDYRPKPKRIIDL